MVGSWLRVCMENVIVVDPDEKNNTIAPLKLYFLLLGCLSCQSAVRRTVLNKGHNELELKKPGQISMLHRAFFNSIIDKHQHMHLTFNTILVYNADFNVKIYKNT